MGRRVRRGLWESNSRFSLEPNKTFWAKKHLLCVRMFQFPAANTKRRRPRSGGHFNRQQFCTRRRSNGIARSWTRIPRSSAQRRKTSVGCRPELSHLWDALFHTVVSAHKSNCRASSSDGCACRWSCLENSRQNVRRLNDKEAHVATFTQCG